MIPEKKRYLLCRPAGGLNDTLCQIEKCWRHAETYGRHLVIDTAESGLMDDFFRYFVPRPETRITVSRLTPELVAMFDAMDSVFPAVLSGRVSGYAVDQTGPGDNLCEAESRVPLCFDLDRDHDAQLLVHHQYGGGLGFSALRRLSLTPPVAADVLSRHRDLKPGYVAIHIRNTDAMTDYAPVFRSIRPFVRGRTLLICSDDKGCIDHARDFYGTAVRVVSNANLPDTGGKTLHYNEALDRFAANCDALADVFWLSMSRRLFLAKTHLDRLSGYSRLAAQLACHRDTSRALVAAAGSAGPVGDSFPGRRLRDLAGRRWNRSAAPVWLVRRLGLPGNALHVATPYRIRVPEGQGVRAGGFENG